MDPLSIAMLASGLLNYNTQVDQAAKTAQFDSTVTRGGKWSSPELQQMASQHGAQPNLWGNIAAGATAAAGNEHSIKQDANNSELIKALAGGNRYRGHVGDTSAEDFSVPETESSPSDYLSRMGAIS